MVRFYLQRLGIKKIVCPGFSQIKIYGDPFRHKTGVLANDAAEIKLTNSNNHNALYRRWVNKNV